ncbi:DUF4224 domain-containing protein [Pseudomonas sp. P8_241]|uniref:DUF4224 domain-containing protein n=1 Tax=Pseudomonas sp. P8_241 TaxID=3043445 RepID=UPI002A365499|nr:DUF4224 domain-containing protein [Pseudomonas sp. P8_241]WPN45125.1 DUF4224 domain-containing protein [Pseudomonas sp. P8_241]
MESEILSKEELVELTGYKVPARQRQWLIDRQWVYELSRNRPRVGRYYARMKLGMVIATSLKPAPAPTAPVWTPDFSRVN